MRDLNNVSYQTNKRLNLLHFERNIIYLRLMSRLEQNMFHLHVCVESNRYETIGGPSARSESVTRLGMGHSLRFSNLG